MRTRNISPSRVARGLLLGIMMCAPSVQAMPPPPPSLVVQACTGCHGTHGISAGPVVPNIAGMPATYLKEIMAEFKSGQRFSTVMGRLAKGYSEEDIARMADFFSKQTWQNAKRVRSSKLGTRIDARLAKKGKKLVKKAKCDMCHENNGVSQNEDTPRIAGQWLDYLLFKLKNLKNPTMNIPQTSQMKRRINRMSPQELEAVAHFYASQK